jgi:AcrR family transcriptional regulator
MTNQDVSAGGRRQRTDTKRRLIDAGYEVLARDGLQAATVSQIARATGVSPGLFHYHFTSKEELLLAVAHESGERFKHRMISELRDRRPGRESIAEVAVAFIHRIARDEPQLFRIRYELYGLAMHNPAMLVAVAEKLAMVRGNITRILGALAPEMDPQRLRALAAVVLACFDGLALQQLADPDADHTGGYELLRAWMDTELAADDVAEGE